MLLSRGCFRTSYKERPLRSSLGSDWNRTGPAQRPGASEMLNLFLSIVQVIPTGHFMEMDVAIYQSLYERSVQME